MFEELLINVAVLLVSLFALGKASDLTISNSIKVADITGFGKTTIGFILVAFTTSLPELLVSVFAAVNPENIGIAVGNVLGSNIVNICLILGICFLFVAFKNPKNVTLIPHMAKEEIGSLYFGLFVASIIPLTLLYIGYASQIIGVILLIIFVYYLYKLSKIKRVRNEGSLGSERRKLGRYTLLAFLGAAGVVISAYFIVDTASNIASAADVPPVVIGATIVAFGTSIPELATSLDATNKGHLELTLGNIVGSCFINITCILGATLAFSTLEPVVMTAFSNVIMFSLITNLFLWYFLSSERISWREGAVLLFMYFVFLVTSFGGYKT
ncbi:MAG: sodium:calcium antiporter [Candidatus Bathyarchaeia archaeon]